MASDICYVCGAHNMRGSVCLTCCPDGDPRLKPANTPVAPVSPDATGKCGELETVGYVTLGWLNKHCSAHTISAQQTPAWTEAVVTRSQAVELLAAERAEKERAEKERAWSVANNWLAKFNFAEQDNETLKTETVTLREALISEQSQRRILEDDNTALTARVNGFEGFLDDLTEILDCERDIGDVINEIDAMNNRAEALEAKLAAAEKVRVAAERVVWFDWSDNDDDAVKAVSDLRAALGGKPS